MLRHQSFLRSTTAWAVLGLAALTLPLMASGQVRYRVRGLGGLGTNNSGANSSEAHTINSYGQVAGISASYDNAHKYLGPAAFFYNDSALTNLGNFGMNDLGKGSSFAHAINDSGQIVGEAEVYDTSHKSLGVAAFLYQNGTLINLGNFGTGSDGSGSSEAYAINSAGDIVGASEMFDSAHKDTGTAAFLYHNGSMTNLGNFGTDGITGEGRSEAYGINSAGDVVGLSAVYDSAHNPAGLTAFLYHNGTMTDLGRLGTDSTGSGVSEAFAINDIGQVVGFSKSYDSNHNYLGDAAVLWQNGTITNLGNLGTDSGRMGTSIAYAINNKSDIVGYSLVPMNTGMFSHAFVYHNGKMIDLNTLIPADSGWVLSEATGINDRGQICGTGGHNDIGEGFILDPISDGDFNGDGHADLLWQNPASGQTYLWMMHDRSFVSGTPTSLSASPDWHVIATPDLNGDGKPDFLWQNSKTGDVAYWLLDGGKVLSGKVLATGIGTDWHLIGTADFNQDGKSDLLWWNARTSSAAVWYLNGTTFVSSALLASGVNGWTLTGVMPHLADNKVSLLWRNNANGDLGYWVMNNTTVQPGGLIAQHVPKEWQVAGVTDLDGDGQPDLLWQNQATGEAGIWYMQGATYKSGSTFAGTIGTNWRLIGAR